MYAALLQHLATGSRKPDGTPNASGRAWLYQLGGTTPAIVYLDANAEVQATQPIALDAAGKAEIYLTGPVRLVTESVVSTGVYLGVDDLDVFTAAAPSVGVRNDGYMGVDPDTGSIVAGGDTNLDDVLTSLAGSPGGTGGNFLATTGATERTLQSVIVGIRVSVRDFGAIGNGISNDTAAIQAAVNFAATLNGGVVFFDAGNYLISSAITLSNETGISFVGTGMGSSTITSTSTTANVFTFVSCNHFRIECLNITASAGSTGTAISLSNCSSVIISKVGIDAVSRLGKHKFGLDVAGATANFIVVESCQFYATGAGARTCLFEATSFANFNFLVNSYFNPQLEFTNATGNLFATNCTFANTVIFAAALSGTGFWFANCLSVLGFTFSGTDDRGAIRTGLAQVSPNMTFAVGTTQVPDRSGATWCRMTANAGGAGVVTVSAPTPTPLNPSPDDTYFGIRFKNASGGAVTWTLNAVFKVTAAIPTTDGHTINVLFGWDSTALAWREVSRADTVT